MIDKIARSVFLIRDRVSSVKYVQNIATTAFPLCFHRGRVFRDNNYYYFTLLSDTRLSLRKRTDGSPDRVRFLSERY